MSPNAEAGADIENDGLVLSRARAVGKTETGAARAPHRSADGHAAETGDVENGTERQAIAVCGAHMSGLPLNFQLVDMGAAFIGRSRTSADYRLFALEHLSPSRPGLLRVAAGTGAAIEIEIWELPIARVGRFLGCVPPPLCIGHVSLADGSAVHGFLCEAYATKEARDITAFGGWRQFLGQARTNKHPSAC